MSFVTVKYADNKCRIFNHNCKNGVLLGYIKEKCGLDPCENIDLSDERGYVKQLHYNLDDYGTEYLRDREILILLKVNRLINDEEMTILNEDDVTYTPLLDKLADDTIFLGQLNPKTPKNGKRKPSKRGTASLSSSNNKKRT